jgi:hypothetical protein
VRARAIFTGRGDGVGLIRHRRASSPGEEVFEAVRTDLTEMLRAGTKEFGPLDKLWTCAKEWVEQSHAWHELPLPQVDAEAAASKAGEFGSQLARVSKVLEKKGESRENAARCCKLLLQETKSFEDDEAPLMLLVRSSASHCASCDSCPSHFHESGFFVEFEAV